MGACVLESLCRMLVFLIVSFASNNARTGRTSEATRDTDVALEPVVSLFFKMVSKQLESLTSVIRDKTYAPMQSSVI